MSASDVLLANNATYSAAFAGRDTRPDGRVETKVAIVACMDARMDVYGILGLKEGEAHVIRNAGGLVTDQEIRSLAISQRLLGTEEIVLIHHTDCGMTKFTDAELQADLKAELGIEPPWAPGAFTDLDADVRQAIATIHASPFIKHKHSVRGFVYDVETGRLREVSPAAP